MTDNRLEWMHFSASRRPKRRRAELVCVSCHAKKVKCDLQARTKYGHGDCSACEAAARECVVRTSRRGKGQQSSRAPPDSLVAPDDSDAPDVIVVMPPPMPSPLAMTTDSLEVLPKAINVTMETPQSQHSSHVSTSRSDARHSHAGDVDTGFLHVYQPENQSDAQRQEMEATLDQQRALLCPVDEELQESFAETYWENCYAWCPVLDRDTLFEDVGRSPLLAYALALAASHIQPPLIPHEGPSTYYQKARELLYNDEETNKMTELRAVALFYWWAPRAPTIAHRHSSWWWTSVVIRQAQQMNLHREPRPDHPMRDQLNLALRRKIWWTAFSRERLTALCQSKPCIIDPEDCNVPLPTPADFPPDSASQKKGLVFIHWVKLCAIMGDVAKALSRTSDDSSLARFPHHLRRQLLDWVQALPEELHLPIQSSRTSLFDRDVHQLHLPYLTTIIVLHLQRSAHALPQALPPAILAASCTARILKDILSRGNTRYLMAITCWYAGTAFIALLQACRISHLSKEANEGLDILERAIDQLQQMWATANVFREGFKRLRGHSNDYNQPFQSYSATLPMNSTAAADGGGDDSGTTGHHINTHDFAAKELLEEFDWTELFPFVTRATSGIADSLLSDREQGIPTRGFPSPENMFFQDTLMTQYQDLLEPFTDYTLAFPDMGLEA